MPSVLKREKTSDRIQFFCLPGVGPLVGSSVGPEVGPLVGAWEGPGVGPAVGSWVKPDVGPAVGPWVGPAKTSKNEAN